MFSRNYQTFVAVDWDRLRGAKDKCLLSIDCSTTGTGIALIEMGTGSVEVVAHTKQIKKGEDEESLIEYRMRLKESIKKLLLENPGIFCVVYEPPVVGFNAHTTGVLFTLKGFAEEAVLEIKKEYPERNLVYLEYINTKWKKHFFEPDSCPVATKLAKEAIKTKMMQYLITQGAVGKELEQLTQDELDASAMGIAYRKLILTFREEEAITKKKQRPFKYELAIVSAENEVDLLRKISSGEVQLPLPNRLKDKEMLFKEWVKRYGIEKFLFQDMAGLDMLIAYKVKVGVIGDLILKYRRSDLAADAEATVYVIAWRLNPTSTSS